uniref:Uncharacterized protein n=1 Tax=Cacopsylla melanoneura TaxID=428564 RepID=A0A8D9BNC6_9HEMI
MLGHFSLSIILKVIAPIQSIHNVLIDPRFESQKCRSFSTRSQVPGDEGVIIICGDLLIEVSIAGKVNSSECRVEKYSDCGKLKHCPEDVRSFIDDKLVVVVVRESKEQSGYLAGGSIFFSSLARIIFSKKLL